MPTLHLDSLLVQRADHTGDVLITQLLEEGVAVVQPDQNGLVGLLFLTYPSRPNFSHRLLRYGYRATLDSQQLIVSSPIHSHLIDETLVCQWRHEGCHGVGGAVNHDKARDLGRKIYLLQSTLHTRLQYHVHYCLRVRTDGRDVGNHAVELLHRADGVREELEGGEIIMEIQVTSDNTAYAVLRVAGADFQRQNIVVQRVDIHLRVHHCTDFRHAAPLQQLLNDAGTIGKEE